MHCELTGRISLEDLRLHKIGTLEYICDNMIKTGFVLTAFLHISVAAFTQTVVKELEPLQFLTGSWSFATPKGKLAEAWKYNSESSFSGKSYKINQAGDSTLLETVLLSSEQSGVYYIVKAPGNDSPVRFKLASSQNNIFIFENKEHDFPQRVVYQKKSDTELLAWIEGLINGKLEKQEFPYRRD